MKLQLIAVSLLAFGWVAAPAADTGSVLAVSRAQALNVAAAAARIDALIDQDLAEHHLKPNGPISDLTFLRRASLDIIGRIPAPDEIIAFLKAPSGARRHDLVESLLGSDGYVSSQFNWWGDLLRIQSQLQFRFPGEPYIDWVKQSIRADMPYDRMVRALITASGPALKDGDGATGYYLRDAGMPQDNMSNTIQVFLGTRLACAQCHNHPFDKWSRLDYWEMSAYTSSTRTDTDPALVQALRAISGEDKPQPKRPADKKGAPPTPEEQLTRDRREAERRFVDAVGSRVADGQGDTVGLPKDYQYKDAKPGQTVHAHPIFGDISVVAPLTPRVAYANWLTSADNPRFTLVIANRMWKRVFGIGLIEPADNITDASAASNPALMQALVDDMKACGYDLKRFQEILYSTKAYQRALFTEPVRDPAAFHVQGPVLRRLGAEQIWDSLLTLVVDDLDERKLVDPSAAYNFYQEMSAKSPQEVWGRIVALADATFKKREVGNQMKAMLTDAPKREVVENSHEFRLLRDQAQALDKQLAELSFDRYRYAQLPEDDPRWKGVRRDFVRASELQSPAPPGHFLRDFGQSDRNLIDNGNRTAAVTQALTLLNGFVDQNLFQKNAVLMRAAAISDGRPEKLRTLFIAILTREPTAAEKAAFAPWLAGLSPDEQKLPPQQADAHATDSMVRAATWALVNSHEFLFEP